MWLCPDVGAVMGGVDGQVPEQQHTARFGMVFKRLPLAREHELFELGLADQVGMLISGLGQRFRLAVTQGFRPLPPGKVARGLL